MVVHRFADSVLAAARFLRNATGEAEAEGSGDRGAQEGGAYVGRGGAGTTSYVDGGGYHRGNTAEGNETELAMDVENYNIGGDDDDDGDGDLTDPNFDHDDDDDDGDDQNMEAVSDFSDDDDNGDGRQQRERRTVIMSIEGERGKGGGIDDARHVTVESGFGGRATVAAHGGTGGGNRRSGSGVEQQRMKKKRISGGNGGGAGGRGSKVCWKKMARSVSVAIASFALVFIY